MLYRRRRELRKYAAKAFPGEGHRRIEESRIAELERKVGRQAMEIDFLRRCLQRVEEQRRLQALTTRSSSTPASRKK
jgi:transposase